MEYGILRWNKECFVRTRTKAGDSAEEGLKNAGKVDSSVYRKEGKTISK
jgi:hypothetical protein